MALDFTIAIPTYNGAQRIPSLLDRLSHQIGVEQVSWEIIIVDNNSQDNTREIVEAYQASDQLPVPLHYYFEPEQGAAFARQQAVRRANGEWIGFLDDDNLPAHDWLLVAYEFRKKHPNLGAFSGQIHGNFEAEPPEDFARIQEFLAIRHHGETAHRFDPKNLRLPPAASLVIRRQAWLESVPKRPTLSGKRPGFMVQGDDYEPLLYLHRAGWEIWYTPDLQSYHQIPAWRFEQTYLVALAKGCGLATCQLQMINAKTWQKPFILVKTFLGSLKRTIRHLIHHRFRREMDVVSSSELAFHLGSLMSPFLCLKISLGTVNSLR